MILTKPPAGMALTPNSVSPRLRDHSVGPNPRKNCVAFMPYRRAVAKCPASCSMTEASRATTKATTPTSFTATSPTSHCLSAGCVPAADQLAGTHSRFLFHFQHIGNRGEFPEWRAIEHVGNCVGDAEEGQPTVEEGTDGLFVRSVEDRGCRA